jgi:hypothetical protein
VHIEDYLGDRRENEKNTEHMANLKHGRCKERPDALESTCQ